MSAAVASAPSAPLAPPPSESEISPKSSYPTLAPATHTSNQIERSSTSATPNAALTNTPVIIGDNTAQQKVTPDAKRSPNS